MYKVIKIDDRMCIDNLSGFLNKPNNTYIDTNNAVDIAIASIFILLCALF